MLRTDLHDGQSGDIVRFTRKGGLKHLRFPECSDKLAPPPTREPKSTAKPDTNKSAASAMTERGGVWRGGGVSIRRDGVAVVLRDRSGAVHRAERRTLIGLSLDPDSVKILGANVAVEGKKKRVEVSFEWTKGDDTKKGTTKHVFE